MSSFYGIWNRDGTPITREEARSMQHTFDWWKPDESGFILEKNLLIGQATLRSTPESKHEHLPLRRGPYILAADARIDNRQELARQIDLPDRPIEEIGDGEFILAAYEKWGEACVDRLLGDFAFVLWDERKRTLFCARDFIGVRPFYYYLDKRRFLFGSDLESLIKSSGITPTLRQETLADCFANLGIAVDTEHTFFHRFERLDGGCFMTVSETERKITRYWHPARIKKTLRFRDERAWTEELRRLLERAVSDRLRSDYPVAAHLSGGLDSSPLSVLTARHIKRKDPTYTLPVYSWQPEPVSPEQRRNFEWAQAIETAQREGMELHFSRLDAEKVIEGMKRYNLLYDQGSSLWNELDIRDDLYRRGIRTMVSGWGGDEFVTNHGYPFYVEMLLSGRWLGFGRRLRERIKNREMDTKATLKFLYKWVLVPMLPTSLYCRLPRIHCTRPDLELFTPAFRPYVEEAYKRKTHIFVRYTSRTLREELIRAWKNGHVQARINAWSQESLETKMRYVYPLLDRRLIEFAFQVPTRYLVRNGYDRHLYRRSLEGILPKNVIWGVHKSEPGRWKQIQKTLHQVSDRYEKEKKDTLVPYLDTVSSKHHEENLVHFIAHFDFSLQKPI